MKEYRQRSGMEMTTGNFYRELNRLVGEGLVTSAANPPGVDNRRTPYQITSAGLASFEAWLAGPTGMGEATSEDELSARTLFLPEINSVQAQQMLDRWQDELWSRGKLFERLREGMLRRTGTGKGRLPAQALLLGRRLKHVAADLDFLDELRSAFSPDAQGGSATRPRLEPAFPSQSSRPNRRGGPKTPPSSPPARPR